MSEQRRRIELEPAFLLHTRAYRDTSLILEGFTPQYGRVGLVARGARSGRSRWRGLLQPFVPLMLSWSGRGELGTLTGAEAHGRPRTLAGERLAAGFYLNELVMRLLRREDPHPALFAVYDWALSALVARDQRADEALRLFEKRLLEALGYGLILDHDSQYEAIDPAAWYAVDPEGLPERTIAGRADALVVRGSSLVALAREGTLDEPAAWDAKRLMRAALAPHLGSRPLKSRELYRQLASFRSTAGPDEA